MAWAVALTVFHLFISMLITVAFTAVLFSTLLGHSSVNEEPSSPPESSFSSILSSLELLPTVPMSGSRQCPTPGLGSTTALACRQASGDDVRTPPHLLATNQRIRGVRNLFHRHYSVPRVVAGLPHISLVQAQFIDTAVTIIFSSLIFWQGVSWVRRAGWGPGKIWQPRPESWPSLCW